MFQSQYFEGSAKFGSNCEVQGWTNAAMPGRHRAAYGYCSGNPVNMVDPTGLFDFFGFFDAISNFFTGSSSIDLNNTNNNSYQMEYDYQTSEYEPYGSFDFGYSKPYAIPQDEGVAIQDLNFENMPRTIDPRDPSSYQNQRGDIGTEQTSFCNYTQLWNVYRMAYYKFEGRWLSTEEANTARISAESGGAISDAGNVNSGYNPIFDVFNQTFKTTYNYSYEEVSKADMSTTPPDGYGFSQTADTLQVPYIWYTDVFWLDFIENRVAHCTTYLGFNDSNNRYEVMNVWYPKIQALGPIVDESSEVFTDRWPDGGGYRVGLHTVTRN